MKIRNLVAAALAAAFLCTCAFAGDVPTEDLAVRAVSEDTATASESIAALREMGPAGLDVLFTKYSPEIDRFARNGEPEENWKRIANALDTVAMQKDAYASHLYWYTDLEDARRAALKENKPILSLRLLGNLSEEFSCANSRLFRAILYPHAEVSKYLRDNYILHWRSVRPAPKVTIDFGDGRKIERTLTGNSIHYILTPQGEIIDALPGLYGPQAFLKYLAGADRVNKQLSSALPKDREKTMMKYRKATFDKIVKDRDAAVMSGKVALTEPKDTTTALDVEPRAMAKAVVVDEVSILRLYDAFAKYEPQIDNADWSKLAEIYSPSPKIDANSISFIRRQNAKTGLSGADFVGLFTKLENFISLDITRNDFLFHTKLYQWLNDGNTGDIETFNTRVYARIFKTPNTDKWLGLYSPDIYTALDGNGFIDSPSQ